MVFPHAGIFSHNPPAAGYVTTGNDYDGTNDFASRGAGLTGAADGKVGIVSFWVRLDGGDGSSQHILQTLTVASILFQRFSDDKFYIICRKTDLTNIMLVASNTTYTTADGWIHVLASWNLATPEAHLFINNINDEAAGSTETDDTIDYTAADWFIGANNAGAAKLNGCLSEFYLNTAEFLDISNAANRAKFISGGKPVDLGADGSTPTGTAPIIYASDGDPSTNAGGGGNFSITGALSACSDSPSD